MRRNKDVEKNQIELKIKGESTKCTGTWKLMRRNKSEHRTIKQKKGSRGRRS
jgi:hypothetical protein